METGVSDKSAIFRIFSIDPNFRDLPPFVIADREEKK
jgi:hypothetical protein